MCGASLSDTYVFNYTSSPVLTVCVTGNPPPELEFNFDGSPGTVTRKLMNWQTHQYEFDIQLPKLVSSHCGKKLKYSITSKIQPTPAPIARELTIFVKG